MRPSVPITSQARPSAFGAAAHLSPTMASSRQHQVLPLTLPQAVPSAAVATTTPAAHPHPAPHLSSSTALPKWAQRHPQYSQQAPAGTTDSSTATAGVELDVKPRTGDLPLLLVSDLDGTMVGESEEATAAFKAYWEAEAVPRGGVLVFNTGRSLSQALDLFEAKSHCMPQPDALITAVGTHVHWWDGRRQQWVEDGGWREVMQQGWSEQAVRAAVDTAMGKVQPGQMNWRSPEDQSEFKLTVGMHMSVYDAVVACIQQELVSQGVHVTIITSWHKDQRVLDIVPARGGKAGPLEYVRQRWGFAPESTVAAGDAGNDILMLSGVTRAIAVGNASPELRHWMDHAPPEQVQPQRLYRAQAHEARGLLEGLASMGFR